MILLGAVAVVAVGIMAAQFLFPSKPAAPAPSGTGTNTGGSSVVNPLSSSPAAQGSQPGANAQSKEAVQAAYSALLRSSNPDNIQPQGTVIAGEYALQDWAGTVSGGQALLRYNSAQDTWAVVVSTGGTWSADELVRYEGVPADVAAQLVAGTSR